MSDLLETVIETHGGLERWNQLHAVSARLVQGGALWTLKGQQGVLDDVFVRASLHEERESHHPFGAPTAGARSSRSASMILPHYSYLLAGLIPQARVKIYPDSAHGSSFSITRSLLPTSRNSADPQPTPVPVATRSAS